MSVDGNDRPNFFKILELEPNETDLAKIDAVIKTMTNKWNRDKTTHPVPAKRLEAKQYSELAGEIDKVMHDPQLRQAEADAWKQLSKEIERESLAEVREKIGILSQKGFVLDSELKNLVKKYKNTGLSEAAIRREIKVPVNAKADTSQPRIKALDKVQVKDITANLAVLKLPDLYAFLGLSRNASLASLQSKSKDIQQDARGYANKTAEIEAKLTLAGHCNTVFADESSQQSYDQALADAGLIEVTDTIHLIGGDRIDQNTYAELVKMGMQTGCTEDRVQQHIATIAKKKGLGVEVPSSKGVELPQCGHCGTINDANAVNCHNCGQPLFPICPGCSNKAVSTDAKCNKCGFPLGDLPEIEKQIGEARRSFQAGDLRATDTKIRALEDSVLSRHQTYQPLADLKAEIEKREKAQTTALKALRDAVAANHMEDAARQLRSLPAIGSAAAEIKKIDAAVQKALGDANYLYRRAAAAEQKRDTDALFRLCADALTLVADHSRAQSLMSKYPPEPVAHLDADGKQVIELTWLASRSSGMLEYLVVRKEGSAPRSPNDGQELATVRGTSYSDPDAEPGLSCYYGVFTVRAGATSAPTLAGPVMRIAEVEGVAAKPGSGVVNLSWQSPPQAAGFEIWRTEGHAPRRRRQGDKISGARHSGIADTNVQNGVTYGYLIVTVFEHDDGSRQVSAGVRVTATPEEPPEAVRDLRITRKRSKVSLTWAPPRHGQVEVYRMGQAPKLRHGAEMDVAKLGTIGKKVPVISPTSAEDDLGKDRVAYYVPVTVAGSMGVIGTGVVVTAVEDVSGLQIATREQSLLVKWTWPANTKLCRVAVRTDGFSTSAEDPQAIADDVNLSVYETRGGHIMSLPGDHDAVYVSVHSGVLLDGDLVFSAGSTDGARQKVLLAAEQTGGGTGKCKVDYQIEKPTGWLYSLVGEKKGFRVRFRSMSDDVTLPALCLVTKRRMVPIDIRDGRTIVEVPAGLKVPAGEEITWDFKTSDLPKNTLGRLFLKDPADAGWLNLTPLKARMDIGG